MDISYLLWLQDIRLAAPAPVQGFFAFLGTEVATYCALVLLIAVYWCVDRRRGVLPILSYATSLSLGLLLKSAAACYRPWVRDARIQPEPSAIPFASGYSFPSVHTSTAASVAGGFAWPARARKRWPVVVALAVTCLVAFSRNWLGVHTPQDIVVGFVVGWGMMMLCERVLALVDAHEDYDLRLVVGAIILGTVFLVFEALRPYPMDLVNGEPLVDPSDMIENCYQGTGVLFGTLVGWYVERHFVRFETDGLTMGKRVLRMLVGCAILLFVHVLVGHAIKATLGANFGQLLRHVLTFFVAMAGLPALFVRLRI